jgi:hypothetical protein
MGRHLLSCCCALLWLAIAAAAQTSYTGNLGENLCTSDALSGVVGGADGMLSDGTHSVLLTWTASSSSGVNFYSVYRGTVSGGPYTKIASPVCGTSYVDPNVPGGGQPFFYVVTATACGLSGCAESNSYSNQVGPENIPTFDALSAQQALHRGLSESLSTGDAISAHKGLHATLSETLTTSDSLTPRKTLHRSMAQALSTSDELGSTFLDPNSASLTESLTTADALSGQQTLSRGLSETLSTVDTLTAQQGHASAIVGPVPQIFWLGSGLASAGACGFVLEITGNHFNGSAIAQWNGADRETTVHSPAWLSMTVTAADLAAPGTFAITVSNPGNQLSPVKYFWVLPDAPTISGARLFGGALLVDGQNFSPATTVFWNGTALLTSWISQSRLQAVPPGSKPIGANVVTVANTGCGDF